MTYNDPFGPGEGTLSARAAVKTLAPYRVQTTDGQITDDCRTFESAYSTAQARVGMMGERFEVWRFSEDRGWHCARTVYPA